MSDQQQRQSHDSEDNSAAAGVGCWWRGGTNLVNSMFTGSDPLSLHRIHDDDSTASTATRTGVQYADLEIGSPKNPGVFMTPGDHHTFSINPNVNKPGKLRHNKTSEDFGLVRRERGNHFVTDNESNPNTPNFPFRSGRNASGGIQMRLPVTSLVQQQQQKQQQFVPSLTVNTDNINNTTNSAPGSGPDQKPTDWASTGPLHWLFRQPMKQTKSELYRYMALDKPH